MEMKELVCVSACVVNLPWQMRLASSEDELTLVHTLKSVFVFSHSLPAGSLGSLCIVTFRDVNTCTQTHTHAHATHADYDQSKAAGVFTLHALL